MDLAEIRKKAKRPKAERAEAALSVPPRQSLSIQGTPAGAVPVTPIIEKDTPGLSVPAISDPLEELFSATFDVESVTEDTYLQGLVVPENKEEEVSRQYLTFRLGDEEYALDIVNIREIIKPREITDIPRVPEFILGIISLRGIIIPVFDLKKRLKLGEVEVDTLSRIIVCQMDDRIVGMLVDSISQVVRLSGRKIEAPPAVLSGLDRDLVEGVGRYQGRMMILLHLSCVMDAELV